MKDLLATDASIAHETVTLHRIDQNGNSESVADLVSAEEPLEIRLSFFEAAQLTEKTIAITMRTPGDDADLAVGFLFGEGIIKSMADLDGVSHCGPPSPDKGLNNVIKVALKQDATFDASILDRHFYTSSSCGVCGKTSIDAVKVEVPDHARATFSIDSQRLLSMNETLKNQQTEFALTGGLHGAALFDSEGSILLSREDVGRHNAVDKLLGAAMKQHISTDVGLMLSGRASFELLQKAAMAGIQLVAAVGPPSSLAVEMALEQDITLVGFLNGNRCNIYHGKERIAIP